MIWWDDMERNGNGEYDSFLYNTLRCLTCLLWHRHPKSVEGSWYGWVYLKSGTRCARCGAWLKMKTVVSR